MSLTSYIIWNVDPNIFSIPWIDREVRWYGLLWMVGLLLSYQILAAIFKKENKPLILLDNLTWRVILGTIIGARLGHVLFYNPRYYFLENPVEILAIWEGGLASHGGAIGILFAMVIFCKKHKIDFLWLADRMAIVIPVASCCIRVGNLFNSEMIGTETTLSWAFVFLRYDLIPRHPAQVYEAVAYLMIALTLLILFKMNMLKRQGMLFACMMIAMFTCRFVLEEFKLNQEPFENGLLFNMGQLLSLPFLFFALALFIWINRKPKIS